MNVILFSLEDIFSFLLCLVLCSNFLQHSRTIAPGMSCLGPLKVLGTYTTEEVTVWFFFLLDLQRGLCHFKKIGKEVLFLQFLCFCSTFPLTVLIYSHRLPLLMGKNDRRKKKYIFFLYSPQGIFNEFKLKIGLLYTSFV